MAHKLLTYTLYDYFHDFNTTWGVRYYIFNLKITLTTLNMQLQNTFTSVNSLKLLKFIVVDNN